jgi:hypothetical protein
MLRRRPNVQQSAQAEMSRIVDALEALVANRRESSAIARHSGRLLGDLLIARGYMVAAELDYALKRQAATGGRLGEIVVSLGFVKEDVVVELLAEQYRIEVLDTTRVSLDRAVARLLSEPRATRLSAVPMRRTSRGILIAIADPALPHLTEELALLLNAPIELHLTTPPVLARLLYQAFEAPEPATTPGTEAAEQPVS